MASETEFVKSINVRVFKWGETMLQDRFSKCGVIVCRMKQRIGISGSEASVFDESEAISDSVFEESEVYLFDLVSNTHNLRQMIYAFFILSGLVLKETAPILAEAVSDCLRTRFNVCEETLASLGKTKVVIAIDVETKRVDEEEKKGDEILSQHSSLYQELCSYEDDGNGCNLMIFLDEVKNDDEDEVMMEPDWKKFKIDVFGYNRDDDCDEIIHTMMNSLRKTPEFLQDRFITDEFQEFIEVKGGLKIE